MVGRKYDAFMAFYILCILYLMTMTVEGGLEKVLIIFLYIGVILNILVGIMIMHASCWASKISVYKMFTAHSKESLEKTLKTLGFNIYKGLQIFLVMIFIYLGEHYIAMSILAILVMQRILQLISVRFIMTRLEEMRLEEIRMSTE